MRGGAPLVVVALLLGCGERTVDLPVDVYAAVLQRVDVPAGQDLVVSDVVLGSNYSLNDTVVAGLEALGYEFGDGTTAESFAQLSEVTPTEPGEFRVEVLSRHRTADETFTAYSDRVVYELGCGEIGCRVLRVVEQVHSDEMPPIDSGLD